MRSLFITGNNTAVGKTVVSAALVEALEADYWKPIQAGDLHQTDTDTVRGLVVNERSVIHPEAYRLETPISPHAAARRENIEINLDQLVLPDTDNLIIVEGAGGIMTPINDSQFMADLMTRVSDTVVIVCSHYLGSINHTLLTIEALRRRPVRILGIFFNNSHNSDSESVILSTTGIRYLGHIAQERRITPESILQYKPVLQEIFLELL